MAGITLEQAQAQLDALLAAQTAGLADGGMASVTIGGRTVTYRSLDELTKAITYWQGMVSQLQRAAAGDRGRGFRLARFGRIQ